MTNIQKITSYLAPWAINLEDKYQWKISDNSWAALESLKVDALNKAALHKQDKAFETTNALRTKIASALNGSEATPKTKDQLHLWVIKQWGGIKGAKDDATLALIKDANFDELDFNRIASTSKIAAFTQPDKYIIYDARVAYSLNWAILASGAAQRFFPIPAGRNSRMMAFDMNVLIRLANKDKYQSEKRIADIDNQLFVPKKEAYQQMNTLVKALNDKLFPNQPLYHTEMLLFSIADKEVFRDMTTKVSLNIEG